MGHNKFFTKLDFVQAYQQVLEDEETAKILTVNTLKGLYKERRRPFGISVAPGFNVLSTACWREFQVWSVI